MIPRFPLRVAFVCGPIALSACGSIQFDNAPNPLLQSREGRREIVNLCHDAVKDRVADGHTGRFARGQITNSDDYGEARYMGALEVVSAAGVPRRFPFLCVVQPSGEMEVMFR
jgi:hypothetical protein